MLMGAFQKAMNVMKFQNLKAQSARAEQDRLAQQKQSEDLLKALLKTQTEERMAMEEERHKEQVEQTK